MTRENNYTIEICFDQKIQNKKLFIGSVPYFGSSSFSDRFEICTDKIIIQAKRSALIPLENIFYNHFSSLYNQIIKSLLFIYSTNRVFAPIKKIYISRARNNKILDEKRLDSTQINQVLDSSFKLNYRINSDKLQQMFIDDQKGQGTLFAISYLLKANTSKNEGDKFERLWKSFNRLYTLIGKDSQDFTCLRNLRQFIVDNPSVLILSTKKITSLDSKKLRNSIRWRSMLLDNFDTEAKTESFRDFVLRYNDKRIMEVLLETKYGFREDYLKKKGFFDVVEKHIQDSISNNIIIDNEIITLLTGKYMYFVRNKSFHGEKIDSTFRLHVNKEDIELKFLNSILEPYLIDLINANDKY
jgi:hypothetical protein